MVVRPVGAMVDSRLTSKPLSSRRQKRSSLTVEFAVQKRRKVDTPQSPVIHGNTPKPSVNSFCLSGSPLLLGVGDMGQLGLGPEITERSRPTRLNNDSLEALGLNEDSEVFTQVCAGGVHTVFLTKSGNVVTCGCNDEGALGRKTDSNDEGVANHENIDSENEIGCNDVIVEESKFGYVDFPVKTQIVMVSAGDSHTAALDSNGQVWLWGTFRGASGPIGLTQADEISNTPRLLLPHGMDTSNGLSENAQPRLSNISHLTTNSKVVKISSGQDHLVCLTDDGRLFTLGCGEQGQLGRVAERFAKDGGRSGMSLLLQPTECRVRGAVRFSDTWAGGFATFARCQTTGAIYACGLNNYGQLALIDAANQRRLLSSMESSEERSESMDTEEAILANTVKTIVDKSEADKSEAKLIVIQGPLIQFMLTRAYGFDPSEDWVQFAISMHHTLALNREGHVYSVGRSDYGRLGLGICTDRLKKVVTVPTRVIGSINDRICSWIACGESCSFAIDSEGKAYSWGMGGNQQLARNDDEDCWQPDLMEGKQLQNRRVIMIDAGGQHTVLLTRSLSVQTDKSSSNDAFIKEHGEMNNTKNDDVSAVAMDCEFEGLGKLDNPSVKTDVLTEKLNASTVPTQPILIAPISIGAPQTRRTRRTSPSSIAGSNTTNIPATVSFSCESTTGSTAGATINSSVHSSAVSDTSSVSSCTSNSSTSSQINSARSTDGGGSSRCSSFDNYSVQSNLLIFPLNEDNSKSLQLRVNSIQSSSTNPTGAGIAIATTSSNSVTNIPKTQAVPPVTMDMCITEKGLDVPTEIETRTNNIE